MVETGQPLQHGPLENHPENSDDDRCDKQRPPITEPYVDMKRLKRRQFNCPDQRQGHAVERAEPSSVQQGAQRRNINSVQKEIRHERAHHIERTMGEIDDVEHAEDHGKPEAEQRVERAVDQSDQKLGVKGRHETLSALASCGSAAFGRRTLLNDYFFRNAQVLLSSGVKAWSPGTVLISL